jgi:nanoRNase/pAp phosphatase (c-di-AMP/oligoRNAs hydrolase)
MLAASIMADSLGLSSEGVTYRSVEILAELIKAGVSLAKLENRRRELMRKSPDLLRYKGELLQRIEYFNDNSIAVITIPWEEIEQYSPLYNPPMLVLDDMRQTEGTDIAIAFKLYKDGKITGKLRANYGKGIAAKVAEHFGGGGHPYASGFKLTNSKSFEEVKKETIRVTSELLATLDTNETV